MAKRKPKSKPTWADVKDKLASFDRAGLLAVLQDLYAADEGNRVFFHARFGLGEDPLQPYKKTIDRWLWPDVLRGQETSASRAKRAISGYKKAIGDGQGLAELMVFYCERAAGFCCDVCYENPAYVDAEPQLQYQSTSSVALYRGSNACEICPDNSGMALEMTSMFCFPSSIQPFPKVLHGNR